MIELLIALPVFATVAVIVIGCQTVEPEALALEVTSTTPVRYLSTG